MKKQHIMVGDKVDYHSIIGGPVTSKWHTVQTVQLAPNNFGRAVAWISGKSGCVALDALTHTANSAICLKTEDRPCPPL
jgi:hypothetical protein